MVESSMKIHVLGSGAAAPSPYRKNSSYIVNWRGAASLIDCSGSPAYEILSHGFRLHEVCNIFLTHEHVDHIYGLPSLVHGMWMQQLFQQKRLSVYGPSSAIRTARALLSSFHLEKRKGAVQIDWEVLDASKSESIRSNLSVKSHPVTHGPTEALGYQFGNVFFTGDCIYDHCIDDVVSNMVETIIIDCGGGVEGTAGHAGAKQIAKFLFRNPGVRNVYLSHIADDAVIEEIHDCFVGARASVQVLSDGDVIEL